MSTYIVTLQTPMTLQANAEVRLAVREIQVRSRRYSILISSPSPITLSRKRVKFACSGEVVFNRAQFNLQYKGDQQIDVVKRSANSSPSRSDV